MSEQQQNEKAAINKSEGITHITVAGFKSIVQEQRLEVRPLTILAGANSSGKSSIMQPLLLLKQTLEANYDPGALLLNGPNVRFTLADQLLSKTRTAQNTNGFHVGIETSAGGSIITYFERDKNRRLDVEQTIYGSGAKRNRLYRNMSSQEIDSTFLAILGSNVVGRRGKVLSFPCGFKSKIKRNRCFLIVTLENALEKPLVQHNLFEEWEVYRYINRIIHLPGLRGNPERTYPITAVGPEFPGTFEKYAVSIINQWQSENNTEKLAKVNRDLARLGLTGGVRAESIDDTQVELLVHRYSRGDKFDPDDMLTLPGINARGFFLHPAGLPLAITGEP